jgi:hypothetical protein
MGMFKKKKINQFDLVFNQKDMMKVLNLEPSSPVIRDLIGWTEKDDQERVEVVLAKKKRALQEKLNDGCTLREEMELEIQIDGVQNNLNNITK